jgi:hypothetical protein
LKSRRSGPFSLFDPTIVLLVISCGIIAGCERSKAPPPTLSVKPGVPLSVHPSEAPTRFFSSEEEIPSTYSTFEGATGSVRVTLEVQESSSNGEPAPHSLNDVLFKAVGDGRICLTIKRPWPEHPNGRVTIACRSGGEESSADFEPELWFHKPGAIVTFESVGGESSSPVGEGTEVILGRYVARNLPHDIRVTLKAMFSKKPTPPRTNAGPKPVR